MNSLKIDKPIRLIELFAGIGSQAKALQRLGADFDHLYSSEIEVIGNIHDNPELLGGGEE